ncbi:MAG: beta-hydroxyacyl-ACP dehydratase [Phycisphaerales bacterium]|nr:beta-hydroxyacyl-ACP dehydratase [Phycisphaerales bacterium]
MRWMWIDRIIELEPRRRMVSVKNISLAEDHLHDHFAADEAGGVARPAMPVMPGSLILEGMAQTAGILIGHAEHFRQKVVLAKINRAEISADVSPGITLRYTAVVDRLDAMGASTLGTVDAFRSGISADPTRIAEIDLMFSFIDQNMSGMGFPEHNFVFSESFRTLLKMSEIPVDF